MSLINDALKKARQAPTASSATAAGPALRPVEPSRPPRNPILTLPFVAGIILVLVLAGVLFAEWFRGSTHVIEVRAKTDSPTTLPSKPAVVEATAPPTAPALAATPESSPAPEPLPEPVAIIPEKPSPTNVTAETSPVTPPAAPAPAPVAEPPPATLTFKLQGIFLHPRQPAAMINGRTVYVGGHIDDARVVAIDSKSATIVTASGRTNVLAMENQ